MSWALRELEAGNVLWIADDAVHWMESAEVIGSEVFARTVVKSERERGRIGAGVGEGTTGEVRVGGRRNPSDARLSVAG